jgi:peptidoglycan/xylan/chitin deacetylase (PgdA/CDA1 family)
LIILNYHQAAQGDLRRHLLYLRKYYRLQFIESALCELYSRGDHPGGKDKRLPLAITFDDGYLDNYTHAYALAQELQIPLNIFLSSAYINKGAAFWWFDNLVEKSELPEITLEGHTYNLQTAQGQYEFSIYIDEQINRRVEPAEQEAYLSWLCEQLQVPAVHMDQTFTTMMNWEQVQEMQQSGLVAFGGHTLHHCTLSTLDSVERACEEVKPCRDLLQEKLHISARVFAYPHGGPEHIGPYGVAAARRAGYDWALTTMQGTNTPHTHPYLIKRVSVDARLPFLLIVFMSSGIWDILVAGNRLLKYWKNPKALQKIQLMSHY